MAESEQRSCALAAATSINGILCTAAGGYLIEQLPDATEETMAKAYFSCENVSEKTITPLTISANGSGMVNTIKKKEMTEKPNTYWIIQAARLMVFIPSYAISS